MQCDVPEWFCFYPYEFMEDEHVVAMTLQERGAYITLLCREWVNGSIPSDINQISRILKLSPKETTQLWTALEPCFEVALNDASRLLNPRLELERKVALDRLAASSKGGKASVRKRRLAKLGSTALPSELQSTPPSAVEVPFKQGSSTVLCNVVSSSLDKWNLFKTLYPPKGFSEERTCRAFLAREDEADAIIAGLRRAVASEKWGKGFIEDSFRFIADGLYKDVGRYAPPEEPPDPYVKVGMEDDD